MSRALTSDKAGYFLNVLLNTDCNPLSSLKDVADDIQEIKEDFIENLEQIEEDQDDLKEKFNENLEDLRAEADEKRQMVEEKIQANMTALRENADKAGDSLMSKFVSKLWNVAYVIGAIFGVAVVIVFCFGCYSVYQQIKLGNQIVTNANIINVIKNKIFG